MEDRIKKVLNHIEDHLAISLTLNDLAAVACLSPSQFHRQFKRQTGRTPFKFVEELKMNKAYQMILEERWMIHELSDQFGYQDYETFSRAFKKYFHFSPDDFKAIVEGIKANIDKEQDHELMIFTLDDSSSDSGLIEQLKDYLNKKNVAVKDLNQARVFKIIPKDLDPENNNQLIKNKFALTKEDKLWKKLLEH